MKLKKAGLVLLLCIFSSCATSDIFNSLGDNISSPNGLAIDSAAKRLYLVNSNSNVLYDWRQGSVQVLNIENPLIPSLVAGAQTDSFSGEAVIDTARKLLYVTNRFSEDPSVTEDRMLVINIDESSADFMSVSGVLTKKDPYGLACCYPFDRMWITTGTNYLEYINLADFSGGNLNLAASLSDGSSITQAETTFITIKGNQAFVSRSRGGIGVINLDEAGVEGVEALDYFIDDLPYPKGIATDGTYIYLAEEETIDGRFTSLLLVIDPSTLTPRTDNQTAEVVDKNDAVLVAAQIEVGREPQQVIVGNQYAFVSSKKDDLVSVIDLAGRIKVKDISVGEDPFGMAIYSPDGVDQYLYVGNVESNTISIIDLSTLTVAATYP